MTYTAADNQKLYEEKRGSVEDCLAQIQSGDSARWANNYNEPVTLLRHLNGILGRLENYTMVKSRVGDYDFMHRPDLGEHVQLLNTFYGPAFVQANDLGAVSYVPSDLPNYFRGMREAHPANVFVAAVTPMDEEGNFYIGMNQTEEYDIATAAVEGGWKILLEVNRNLRRMNGSTPVNIRSVTRFCEADAPPHTTAPIPVTPLEDRIGENVAALIRDGDCIQMGIGGLPNAVAKRLMTKNDLGLHTEQFTTAMGEMIRAGVVNGSRKTINRGLHIGSFADGTEELYETLSTNPACVLRPGSYVVDPFVIAQNDNMVSINTLVEIDLTGQICAESIGPRQISGSGGAFCFAYGAYRSKGGRGIYAFPSRTAKGYPKIKAMLSTGSKVTTLRNYASWIVTEYGAVDLRGRSVRERAELLIGVAHPDDRDALTAQAKELHYL